MLRTGSLCFALAILSLRPERMIFFEIPPDEPAPAAPRPDPAPPPLPPATPPPPAPTLADDGPCPPVFTSAERTELAAPPDIAILTPSRHDSRLLAAWSNAEVHLSTDDGATFRRVLAGRVPVGDVAFDCHGRLHALTRAGEVGTYDPRTKRESWVRVATFWRRGDEIDRGRLVPDGAGVAVVGNTPARRDRLWLVRRGEDGRWRPRHLFSDRSPDYWSGIWIGSIRPLPDGRIQMKVTPNMADYGSAECGYSKLFELIFDVRGGRVDVRDHGEGAEYWNPSVQQDAAGRWLLFPGERAERLTPEQLLRRLETPEPTETAAPPEPPAPPEPAAPPATPRSAPIPPGAPVPLAP